MRVLPLGCACLLAGGLEYYYWEGMYYRPAADGYVIVSAPVGAVVPAIPDGGQQVVVDGIPYYIINSVTYRKTTVGYEVVPMPSTLVQQTATAPTPAATAPVQSSVVNVPAPTYRPLPAQALAGTAAVENTPAAETAGVTNDVFIVNIPNAKGTYTPVAIKRSGIGYVGPQGEFYSEFPRVEQLKLMYGK